MPDKPYPILSIGQTIRDGVIFDPKNWGGNSPLNNPDSLVQTVQRLFTLFAERQVAYVLVGGVALLAYIEGRNTQDIDLIMSVASFAKLPELKIEQQEQYFAKAEYDGLKIDLLLTRNQLFKEVQKKYSVRKRFLEREIPTATIEGLILLKLYALPSLYRQGNFGKVGLYENDIATLTYNYQPDLNKLVEVLRKYLDESDIVELQKITGEIVQRIGRFRENYT